MRFRDRLDAGRRLAAALAPFRLVDPLVVALPRGGVPVADVVAEALGAPLDVLVVRKIGVPWQPEYGLGAVAEGGRVVFAEDVARRAGLGDEDVAAAKARARREVAERVRRFRVGTPRLDVAGRTVVLVDDGVATGGTVRAALRTLRAESPRELVLAVPVAAPDVVRDLAREADRVVVLTAPSDLVSVGEWYEDFRQVEDEEVVRRLRDARSRPA